MSPWVGLADSLEQRTNWNKDEDTFLHQNSKRSVPFVSIENKLKKKEDAKDPPSSWLFFHLENKGVKRRVMQPFHWIRVLALKEMTSFLAYTTLLTFFPSWFSIWSLKFWFRYSWPTSTNFQRFFSIKLLMTFKSPSILALFILSVFGFSIVQFWLNWC